MARKKKSTREVERILTKHPVNKSGFRIEKSKYEAVRNAILNGLRGSKPLTHAQLDTKTRYLLGPDFKGSAGWYTEVVKLDLEARRKVFRSPFKPTVYSLTKPAPPETRRSKGNPAVLKK
jgi:hypothetical protein